MSWSRRVVTCMSLLFLLSIPTAAIPTQSWDQQPQPQHEGQQLLSQQVLLSDGPSDPSISHLPPPAPHPPLRDLPPHDSTLGPRANSVGVLFSRAGAGADDYADFVHVWLPLGRKINTREYPVLPLYPTSVRVTTLAREKDDTTTADAARSSDDDSEHAIVSTPTELDQIRCEVRWVEGEVHGMAGAKRMRRAFFSSADGVVRFDDPAADIWLRGRPVESVRCERVEAEGSTS